MRAGGRASSRAICRSPSASSIRGSRANRYLPKSPKDMSRLQKRMARVGYRSPMAPVIYTIFELGLPLIAAASASICSAGCKACSLGALRRLSATWCRASGSGRRGEAKKLIANGLPDALDLLIVCVEAGMGLDQGIAKAAEELASSHPPLAEELGMITTEIRAGKPRLEAFKNFADADEGRRRAPAGVDADQTDRFGTSVAQALRTQAEVRHEAPPARRGAGAEARRQARSSRSCSACFRRSTSSQSARPLSIRRFLRTSSQ